MLIDLELLVACWDSAGNPYIHYMVFIFVIPDIILLVNFVYVWDAKVREQNKENSFGIQLDNFFNRLLRVNLLNRLLLSM